MTVYVVYFFDTLSNDFVVDSVWSSRPVAQQRRNDLENENEDINCFIDPFVVDSV